MGIMDMFRSTPPAAEKPTKPATDPSSTLPQEGQNTPVSPLDAYAKMFDKAAESPDAVPTFTLDPKVLSEVSGKLNFVQGADSELMQKAMSGDGQAMIELMNTVAQKAYEASLSHASALTDKFVTAKSNYDRTGIDKVVKNHLTASSLSSTPNYSHPVVRQQLKLVSESLSSQHPDASHEEIATMAKQYIADLANAINPPKQDAVDKSAPGSVDWDKFAAGQSQ